MKWPVWIAALLGGVLVLSGCSASSGNDYHYRLTVEVETPDGLVSGSSVIGGKIERTPGGGVTPKVQGEAAIIDLPNGKTMFALLRSKSDSSWAAHIMMLLSAGGGNADQVRSAIRRSHGLLEVPREWGADVTGPRRSAYPMLVTFSDLDDPTGVAEVDPDDLAATFGEGYALKRITVQNTDEPVTTGIEKRLNWLSEYPEPRLDPNYKGSTNPNLPERLWHGDFRKGTLQ